MANGQARSWKASRLYPLETASWRSLRRISAWNPQVKATVTSARWGHNRGRGSLNPAMMHSQLRMTPTQPRQSSGGDLLTTWPSIAITHREVRETRPMLVAERKEDSWRGSWNRVKPGFPQQSYRNYQKSLWWTFQSASTTYTLLFSSYLIGILRLTWKELKHVLKKKVYNI